jgi:hypothetical protein
MDTILKKMIVTVTKNLYLKDPFSSDLGILIVTNGLELIKEFGMENFNFKKLAQKIGSTEPAIYRYFENKHKFLLYLSAWYWGWMEHNLVFGTANMIDPLEKLNVAIKLMVYGPIFKENEFIDPVLLHEIIINESLKGYLTKTVDREHETGIFGQVYKFGERVSEIIKEINPAYKFPKTLVTTVMESSLMQSFHSKHLPDMTESSIDSSGQYEFFHHLVINAITYE